METLYIKVKNANGDKVKAVSYRLEFLDSYYITFVANTLRSVLYKSLIANGIPESEYFVVRVGILSDSKEDTFIEHVDSSLDTLPVVVGSLVEKLIVYVLRARIDAMDYLTMCTDFKTVDLDTGEEIQPPAPKTIHQLYLETSKEYTKYGRFVQKEHYGNRVWARESDFGTHKEHCLCYACIRFCPNTSENCYKAQELYEYCLKNKMTTPVYECPDFALKG